MQNKKIGQSTFDYLILTVVILIVIVPLLFFSTTRIDTNRVAELQDTLNALQEGIAQVNNLGFGTSSVVIVRIPKGVTEQKVGITSFSSSTLPGQPGLLQYRVAGNDLHVQVLADVEGILPLNEGLHYIQLFNNGTHVLLYECGNNRREAFEQCDGTESSACGTILACAEPSHPQACSCFCFSHQDCRASTGLCDLTKNVCVPCSTNSQCELANPGEGKVCLSGQCIDPTLECTTNTDCSYPNLVCNKQAGRCEPCDVFPATPYPLFTGALKDCNPGHSCQIPGSGVASWCGISPIGGLNNPPSVNAGIGQSITLPLNQVSLDGTVTDDGLPNPPGLTTISQTTGLFTILWTKQSGLGTVTFGNANAVDTTATFSQPGTYVLRLTANDNQVSSSDDVTVTVLCATNSQCTYPTQVCVSGACQPCVNDPQCNAPDRCTSSVCIPQSCSGTSCAGGYVCSSGFCTLCSTTVPCPSGTCNPATGICSGGGGPAICGNGLVELGEQCELTSQCPPIAGQIPNCTNCQCTYIAGGGGIPICPNNIVEPGEQCDPPGSQCSRCPSGSGTCQANCMCLDNCEGSGNGDPA
ncbi:hypothetical protein J4208_06245 [Candidatus Woesearchaeota archaeon]|nr:hypothetical protein [Candidatus Woesearchaeota archaeon]